jgi:cellulose synthase/poly-beta-1,6-N-acetylglucosamine synthase-like glycosyltransferase
MSRWFETNSGMMSDPLFSVFMVLIGTYVLVVFLLAIGWQRVVRSCRRAPVVRRAPGEGHDAPGEPAVDDLPSVSVLIPARDEAETIEACIASILENDYPADRLEVIVIDDGSTDGTASRARRAAQRSHVRVQNPSEARVAQSSGGRASSFGERSERIAVRILNTYSPSDAAGQNPGNNGSRPDAGLPSTDRPERGPGLHSQSRGEAASTEAASTQAASNGGAPGSAVRHKAAALRRGVAVSTGDVIVSTDADCTVGERWIRTMVSSCTEKTPYVSGPIRYQWKERWFERFQALEMAALVAVGGGSLGAGFATICNGANVAVRRSLLESSSNGSAPRAAGEVAGGVAADEVLMQHVAYATDRSPVFQAHPDAIVETEGVSSFREYLHQRVRWAWMGSRYPYLIPRLVSMFAWTLHAVLLGLGLGAIFIPAWQPVVVGALIAKMSVDGALIAPATRHLGSGDLLRSFVPASLLWIPVVVTVGILGTFGSVEWKGRRIGTAGPPSHGLEG